MTKPKFFTEKDFEVDVFHEGVLCSATPSEIANQANAKRDKFVGQVMCLVREIEDWYDTHMVRPKDPRSKHPIAMKARELRRLIEGE